MKLKKSETQTCSGACMSTTSFRLDRSVMSANSRIGLVLSPPFGKMAKQVWETLVKLKNIKLKHDLVQGRAHTKEPPQSFSTEMALWVRLYPILLIFSSRCSCASFVSVAKPSANAITKSYPSGH